MKTTANQHSIRRWWRRGKQFSQQGFTLLELLVAIIISGILTSGLLFLVVELAQANRREEVLSQTQQDMRRAIDYVTRDVSEAVFVYATPAAVVNQLSDVTALTGAATNPAVPVVAFWRLDPLDIGFLNPDCSTYGAQENECETLKIRQSTYTLVVYLQQNNEDISTTTTIWEGPSRIIRYELTRYTNIGNLTPRPGYQDPSLSDDFAGWTSTGSTTGNLEVLTDHVAEIPAAPPTSAAACPTPPAGVTFVKSPANSDSFYVCAMNNGGANIQEENQSLVFYLQGDATNNRRGLVRGSSDRSRLPRLQSEVLVRGVIGEDPSQ